MKRWCVRKKKEKGVYRKKEKGWDWKKVFGGWVGRIEEEVGWNVGVVGLGK